MRCISKGRRSLLYSHFQAAENRSNEREIRCTVRGSNMHEGRRRRCALKQSVQRNEEVICSLRRLTFGTKALCNHRDWNALQETHLDFRDQFIFLHVLFFGDSDAIFLQNALAAGVHTFTDQDSLDGDGSHVSASSAEGWLK